MNIPVEPGVVDKNLQATADQKDDEKEIDVVGETKPCWKPLRSHSFDETLTTRRQCGETKQCPLDVSRHDQEH